MRTILIWGIRVWKANRTRAFDSCRFTPSCSDYAIQAIEHHGAVRGSRLAIQRFLRCRPKGAFGPDPVPLHRTDKGVL